MRTVFVAVAVVVAGCASPRARFICGGAVVHVVRVTPPEDVRPVDGVTGDPLADSSQLATYLPDLAALARQELPAHQRFLRKAHHRTRCTLGAKSLATVRRLLESAGRQLHEAGPEWDERLECVLLPVVWSSGGIAHDLVLTVPIGATSIAQALPVRPTVTLRARPDRPLAEIADRCPYAQGTVLRAALTQAAADPRAAGLQCVRRIELEYRHPVLPLLGWGWPQHGSHEFVAELDLEADAARRIAGVRGVYTAESHLDPPLSADCTTTVADVWYELEDTTGRVQGGLLSRWYAGDADDIARNRLEYRWPD